MFQIRLFTIEYLLCFSYQSTAPQNKNLVFHLVGDRLVLEAGFLEYGLNLIFVEVGDANSFDQPIVHQLLHRLLNKIFIGFY